MRDSGYTKDEVLLAIHKLQRDGETRLVRTSALAELLKMTMPSATARLQVFAHDGLVDYQLRRGAVLTKEGERRAADATSRLQNLEQFLSTVLLLPPKVVPEEAERLARFVSERVMSGIVEFLALATNRESLGKQAIQN